MKVLHEDVSKMCTWQLLHNMFYVKDGEAWYRDFERKISCRDLVREICKEHGIELAEESWTDNEHFDEEFTDLLEEGHGTIKGIIGMYYATMWAFAENRQIAMMKIEAQASKKI